VFDKCRIVMGKLETGLSALESPTGWQWLCPRETIALLPLS